MGGHIADNVVQHNHPRIADASPGRDRAGEAHQDNQNEEVGEVGALLQNDFPSVAGADRVASFAAVAVFPAAAVTACSHQDKPAASVVGDCNKADVVGRAAQAGAFLEVGAAVVFATGEWHMEEGSLQAC